MHSTADFRKKQTDASDAAYDWEFDQILIAQSIASQYAILPGQQDDLPYREWATLVSGLMDNTPLGRVVAVRTEKDHKVISQFSPWQRQIRADWHAFRARQIQKQPADELQLQMEQLEAMLANAFGGEQ